MYTDKNFKTKKALKEAVTNGEEVTVYQPGPFAPTLMVNGEVSLEGPHYPEPHKWYARATVVDGIVTAVK